MWININSESSLPLTRQLYTKIKEMILNSSLIPGEKLPSTRSLAKELQISRNTVLEVYNQLISEGYLEGHHGSGTIVTECLPKKNKTLDTENITTSPAPKKMEKQLIDFRSGVPDLEYFPRKEWGKLYRQLFYDLPAASLRYHSPAGVFELRDAIAKYLYRTRGINCNPHNVMITSGSTQGLSYIVQLLYQPDHTIIVEDPLHKGILKVLQSKNNPIVAFPTDENGIITDLLKPISRLSFIYTTPSHQYPLGGILPLQRRIALIQYAAKHNCYILEDDYDSEFRFEGQPINSLYELDPERVIYTGSFSKILAPALRLGFVLLPNELIYGYKNLKQYSDVHTEAISQYALAEFMNSGGLEHHIWRMKKLYNKKRLYLLKELDIHFAGNYEIKGQAAGLHLVVCFHNVMLNEETTMKLSTLHVKIYPVADYCIHHPEEHKNEIILGYAHLSYQEISKGIKLLKEVLT